MCGWEGGRDGGPELGGGHNGAKAGGAEETNSHMDEQTPMTDAERIERLEAEVAELRALLMEHLIKCPGTREEPRAEAEAI